MTQLLARSCVVMGFALLLCTACERPAPPTSPPASGGMSVKMATWQSETDCPVLAEPPTVERGQVFGYRLTPAGAPAPTVESRQTIAEVQGAVIRYVETAGRLGGGPSAGLERVKYRYTGLLPGPVGRAPADDERTYLYPPDTMNRLWAMEKGGSMTLKASESSMFAGVPRTIAGEVMIELLGCGRMKIEGVEEPVRLFRIEQPGRYFNDRETPAIDTVRPARRLVLVSDRTGWPVRSQDTSGTITELATISGGR